MPQPRAGERGRVAASARQGKTDRVTTRVRRGELGHTAAQTRRGESSHAATEEARREGRGGRRRQAEMVLWPKCEMWGKKTTSGPTGAFLTFHAFSLLFNQKTIF